MTVRGRAFQTYRMRLDLAPPVLAWKSEVQDRTRARVKRNAFRRWLVREAVAFGWIALAALGGSGLTLVLLWLGGVR